MRSVLTVALLTLLAACEGGGGGGAYRTYVPGADFREEMQVWVETPDSGTAAVGEWLTLHAARQSGPWELRDTARTDDPPCEKIAPAVREFEVASKVEWQVEPEGRVSYNVPGPPEFERQIRFDQPGTYRLRAVSEGCGAQIVSNQVEVTIR